MCMTNSNICNLALISFLHPQLQMTACFTFSLPITNHIERQTMRSKYAAEDITSDKNGRNV